MSGMRYFYFQRHFPWFFPPPPYTVVYEIRKRTGRKGKPCSSRWLPCVLVLSLNRKKEKINNATVYIYQTSASRLVSVDAPTQTLMWVSSGPSIGQISAPQPPNIIYPWGMYHLGVGWDRVGNCEPLPPSFPLWRDERGFGLA